MTSPYKYDATVRKHFEDMSERIRQAVKNSGIAGYQFADMCEMTPSAVSHFLLGRNRFNRNINTMVKVKRLMHRTADEMFFGKKLDIEAPAMLGLFLSKTSGIDDEKRAVLNARMESMENVSCMKPSELTAVRLNEFANDRLCKSIAAAKEYDSLRLIVAKNWFEQSAKSGSFDVSALEFISICLSFGLSADYLCKASYVDERVFWMDNGQKHYVTDPKICGSAKIFASLTAKAQQQVLAGLLAQGTL